MRFFFAAVLSFLAHVLSAQDSAFVRQQIDTLTSGYFQGRGYTFEGGNKAAFYLRDQLKSIGAKPFEAGYMQGFTLGTNTFPGAMMLKVNSKPLQPGEDYIVHPSSRGISGKFPLLELVPEHLKSEKKLYKLREKGARGKLLVLDKTAHQDSLYLLFVEHAAENWLNASAIVVLTEEKLTWSVGRKELAIPVFYVSKDAWPTKAKTAELAVENVFVPEMQAYNVAGYIPGTEGDSFIVYSAHYDHLGNMGRETFIPGANDNASGTAMLLDLARYYRENPPQENTAFIFFGAEEAGLVGSYHYVEHPLFPLEKIKFLINLDLMGDAGKGITAVNGKIFTGRFALLEKVNRENTFLSEVAARGPAANSDHHPFYEKGVPGFFIYTRGDYKHYHDIHDTSENLPLREYGDLFRLVVEFSKRL